MCNCSTRLSQNHYLRKKLPTRMTEDYMDLQRKLKIQDGNAVKIMPVVGSSPLKSRCSLLFLFFLPPCKFRNGLTNIIITLEQISLQMSHWPCILQQNTRELFGERPDVISGLWFATREKTAKQTLRHCLVGISKSDLLVNTSVAKNCVLIWLKRFQTVCCDKNDLCRRICAALQCL